MAILIDNRHRHLPIPTARIRETAQRILDDLGSPEAELSLVFVDDDEMADLNNRYRGRSGPTNVLAFAMGDGQFSDLQPDLLGDVVISVDTVRREAARDGIRPETHLVRMLVHGILHLSGYDHEVSEAEADRMEDKTEALLAALGVDATPI
ncbi:MAG: rRNA maturation RNase YbeY [Desulfobacterales bacterium]|nr:rRNA maturation RNase YbeY [Desulfobacterales bacterium]